MLDKPNNMNIIDKYKELIAPQKEILDSLPKDIDESGLEYAQKLIDDLQALYTDDDKETVTCFYEEARKLVWRGIRRGHQDFGLTPAQPYTKGLTTL